MGQRWQWWGLLWRSPVKMSLANSCYASHTECVRTTPGMVRTAVTIAVKMSVANLCYASRKECVRTTLATVMTGVTISCQDEFGKLMLRISQRMCSDNASNGQDCCDDFLLRWVWQTHVTHLAKNVLGQTMYELWMTWTELYDTLSTKSRPKTLDLRTDRGERLKTEWAQVENKIGIHSSWVLPWHEFQLI